MSRVRIIKKNDEYTSEYQVGDIFSDHRDMVWRGSHCRKIRNPGFTGSGRIYGTRYRTGAGRGGNCAEGYQRGGPCTAL